MRRYRCRSGTERREDLAKLCTDGDVHDTDERRDPEALRRGQNGYGKAVQSEAHR